MGHIDGQIITHPLKFGWNQKLIHVSKSCPAKPLSKPIMIFFINHKELTPVENEWN